MYYVSFHHYIHVDSAWFNADEIYELLSKWPAAYSDTPDHIPLVFIKKVLHTIVGPLVHLFNLSFMRAEVPNLWRTALITPIPKTRPFTSPHNFRPISITSIFARTFEKILKARIVKHLSEHAIISPFQHGFQKSRSTVTALLQSLNDWTSIVDGGAGVDVIYLDFCKAFDKVPHSKLLNKLEIVGLHPRIIAWICAFLHNRSFQVRVNTSLSEPRPVCSGVPQGAVLSPVLFSIYTYELPFIISSLGVKCCAFADDLKIYSMVSTDAHHQLLQSAVDAVQEWSVLWELPLSKQKTFLMHVGTRNPSFQYKIGEAAITTIDEVCDLGVLLTSDLTFDKHCQKIAAKAMGMLYRLFRALTTKDSAVLLLAYKTYIRPLLEYGTEIFNPSKRRLICSLERVQNSFTRKVMTRSMGFLYDRIPAAKERNLNLGLDSLALRRRKFDLLTFHKLVHGHYSLNGEVLVSLVPSVTRGNRFKLRLSNFKTSCRAHFFINRVASDYTAMSKKHSIPIGVNSFKTLLKKYIRSQR